MFLFRVLILPERPRRAGEMEERRIIIMIPDHSTGGEWLEIGKVINARWMKEGPNYKYVDVHGAPVDHSRRRSGMSFRQKESVSDHVLLWGEINAWERSSGAARNLTAGPLTTDFPAFEFLSLFSPLIPPPPLSWPAANKMQVHIASAASTAVSRNINAPHTWREMTRRPDWKGRTTISSISDGQGERK